MLKRKIEFTDVKADKLTALLDKLTKDRELEYAKLSLYFTEKLQQAFSIKKK